MSLQTPYRIWIGGYRGQGSTFLARLLAQAAFRDNKQAVFLPQSEWQIRGGLTQVQVVIDHGLLSLTEVQDINIRINLHPKARELSVPLAAEHLVLDAYTNGSYELAVESGFEQGLNMVILGELLNQVDICSEDTVAWELKQLLGRARIRQLPLNLALLEAGAKLAETWKISTDSNHS